MCKIDILAKFEENKITEFSRKKNNLIFVSCEIFFPEHYIIMTTCCMQLLIFFLDNFLTFQPSILHCCFLLETILKFK